MPAGRLDAKSLTQRHLSLRPFEKSFQELTFRREHKNSWGGYAALRSSFAATGLNPGNQSRNESLKLSFRTAVRTARNGCTVQRFHLICWLLAMRLAMISLIADSTQPVEMGLPVRRRSP